MEVGGLPLWEWEAHATAVVVAAAEVGCLLLTEEEGAECNGPPRR